MTKEQELVEVVARAIEKAIWADNQVYWSLENGRPFPVPNRDAIAQAALAAARPIIEREALERAAEVAEAHVDEPGLSDNPAYIRFNPADNMAKKIAAAIRNLKADPA